MDKKAREDFDRMNPIERPAQPASTKTYVVETPDGLEYTFDDAEVLDVVIHESGALVVEGAGHEKTHAFAPGAWVRWWIEEAS